MSFPGSLHLTEKMIRTETATQIHPLGTRGYTTDGRIFRYCKNGTTALTIGNLNQMPTAHAHFTDGGALLTAATTLSTSVTLTLTGASITTANAMAEGYLMTKDAATQGQMMIIKSHPIAVAADTTVKFNLEEDSTLTDAVTTGTTVFGFWHNMYYECIVTPNGIPTAMILGVNTMAITASYFFWIQTWGPCLCVLTGAAAVVGHGMCVDTGTAAGEMLDGTTGAAVAVMHLRPFVGTCMEVGAADDHALVYLTISA